MSNWLEEEGAGSMMENKGSSVPVICTGALKLLT